MKPGIWSMSDSEYHSDPADSPSLSASITKILLQQSTAHAKAAHPKLTPQPMKEEADHFDLGSIVHAALLEGEEIAVLIDAPDWRTKAAREARDEARQQGRSPLLAHKWPDVQEMIMACREQLAAHREACNAFTQGKPEQTLVWQEPNGIWCRSRLDWLHSNHTMIDDYKTTGASAHPEVLARTMFQNGWDIQAAFYLRGLRFLDLDCEPQFRFIVQETWRPYALSVVSLSEDVLALANRKVEFAVEQWRQCLERDEWPAYPDRVCYAELPSWEMDAWERREALR